MLFTSSKNLFVFKLANNNPINYSNRDLQSTCQEEWFPGGDNIRHMDVATYKLNWPRGRFSQNIFFCPNNKEYNEEQKLSLCHFIGHNNGPFVLVLWHNMEEITYLSANCALVYSEVFRHIFSKLH